MQITALSGMAAENDLITHFSSPGTLPLFLWYERALYFKDTCTIYEGLCSQMPNSDFDPNEASIACKSPKLYFLQCEVGVICRNFLSLVHNVSQCI